MRFHADINQIRNQTRKGEFRAGALMYLRAEHNEMNETNHVGFGKRGGPSDYSIPTYAEYYEINEEEANRDRAEAYETFYGENNAESNEDFEEWRSSDHRHGPYV